MWKTAIVLLPLVFLCAGVDGRKRQRQNDRGRRSQAEVAGLYDYDRSPGKPLGMMPYCPGFNKSASIADEYLFKHYSVVVQKGWNKKKGMYRKRYFYKEAPEGVSSDPNVDFKRRKTMIALCESPLTTNLDAAYQTARVFSRIGYNSITVSTRPFTHAKYAVTARLAKAVGNVTAILIKELVERGLNPSDLVLVGGSMGAHIAGFAGKYFYNMTGRKIGHIIAIDPSGLCFRHAEPQDRLSPSDADFVQATHFNMFGFGMEAPVGHVDFYVNGGVYQNSWLAALPCLTICSHVRAFQTFYYTIKYPGKFIGTKCKDVHQAINSDCFNNEPHVINTIGLAIDKNVTGVFYVPTLHLKPFFVLDYRRDVVKEYLSRVNSNETLVIDENTKFGYDYSTDIPPGIHEGYDKLKKYDYYTENPISYIADNFMKNFELNKLEQ